MSRLLADDGSPALYAEEVREEAVSISQLVPSFQALILELGSTDRILLECLEGHAGYQELLAQVKPRWEAVVQWERTR